MGLDVTQPGVLRGRVPANKGKRYAAQVLTPDEIRAFLDQGLGGRSNLRDPRGVSPLLPELEPSIATDRMDGTPSEWMVDNPPGWCTIQGMDLSTPLASVVGDARGRLLEAIVRSDRPRSIREWSRRAGVNHAHARSLLREFEDMGLVSSEQVGATTVVVAVPESALRQRLQGLFFVERDIIEAARQGAQSAPPGVTVTLFGSVARESARAGSDVDLCVVAPTDSAIEEWVRAYVEKVQEVSCLPVNLLRFTPTEWDDAVANGERIVDEILRDRVELQGTS